MKQYLVAILLCICSFFATAQYGGAYTSLDGSFGQPTQSISELTDVLYNATKRFTVTPDVPYLFDGYINNANWILPAGSTNSITIDFTTKGEIGTNGITYPQGYVYVSFYSGNYAQTVSMEVKDRDGVWRVSTAPTDISNNSAYRIFRIEMPYHNYLTVMKINITAPAGWATWVSKIEYHRWRPDGELLPAFVSKYWENKMYKAFHFVNESNIISSTLKADGGAFFNGNIGIGTNTPQAKLDVNGNIFTNGKLAIGTTDMTKIGTYSLAVNGDALFNMARVKLYGTWPDYVFKKDYQLTTLNDLEKFIQKNQHLPGVPSAEEVEKTGIDLGGTQAVLLKKIEELTLYIIEQNKRNDKQQEQINALTEQLKLRK